MKDTILKACANGRTALIAFITGGFPSPELFPQTLREIDAAGVDIIEIGVPFSDPVADGPVIEETSRRALAAGVTLRGILRELSTLRGQLQTKLILMGYTNPFMQYGWEALASDSAAAGVSGFIIPDMPLEEMAEPCSAFLPHRLALIPLIGSNTSEERMNAYAPHANEYVYIVSTLGTTGGHNTHVESIADTIRRARRAFSVPLALGFGLKEPSQLTPLPADARPDAVVIGSALLQHLADGGTAAEFFAPWKA